MNDTAKNKVLSNKLVEFILDPRVTIHCSSHNMQLIPSTARGLACKANSTLTDITVWISQPSAVQFADDLSMGHDIAMVVCMPHSHQTIQIKGRKARILAVQDEDKSYIRDKTKSVITGLVNLGFATDFCEKMLTYDENELLAICFQPCAVYEQSPGANAGEVLEKSQW